MARTLFQLKSKTLMMACIFPPLQNMLNLIKAFMLIYGIEMP